MPYEVLARKWRPKAFQDVVGQEHATQTLMNAIRSGRLAQAYLFSGARGVGKTSVARILAKALNCEAGEPGVPCNTCRSCLEITEGSSVDVQEIDGASNRGIDEIRELRENIRYMPSASRYRVFIIDEVHMLTLPAFNALLKTLEEPPPHVKFIFATTEPHKVPVTILSRCQRFDFKRIALTRMSEHLAKITAEEGISVSGEALTMIARAAGGSMRDAQSLLDQVIAFTGPSVADNQVLEILGVIDRGLVFEAGRAVIEGDPKGCLQVVDRVHDLGYDIREFYRTLMEHFRNLMVSLITGEDHLLEMSASEREETLRQAEKAGDAKLQAILNFLVQREETLRYASSPRLVLETLLIKLCHLDDYLSFADILKRLEALQVSLTGEVDPASGKVVPEKGPLPEDAPPEEGPEDLPEGGTEVWEGKDWPGFLGFLARRNRPMFSILKDWTLASLDPATVGLLKGRQIFAAGYFDDPERLKQLAVYVEEYFGRPLQIRISGPPDPQPAGEGPEGRARSTGPEEAVKKKYAGFSPPVQDLLNLFEGQIEEDPGAAAQPENPDQAMDEEVKI